MKKIISQELNNEVCNLYQDKRWSLNKISKKLHICNTTIKRILSENNISLELNHLDPIWNDNIKNEIKRLYIDETLGCKKIGKRLNISEKRILDFIKAEGISKGKYHNKKYKCNSNFFQDINSEKKAYWLGVLYADGNVAKDSNAIMLSSTDKEWASMFLYDLESNNTPHCEFHVKFNKEIWKSKISDIKLRSDLIKWGCVPSKSLIIEFPEINKNLIPHFIRGYFDGDGCVSIAHNDSKKINCLTLRSGFCSGSEKFLNKLVTYLPVKHNIVKRRTKIKGTLYVIQFSVNDSYRLYKYMYRNATVFLQRKKDKFDEYIKQRRSETIIEDLEID